MSQNRAFISIEQFIAELQNCEMFWDLLLGNNSISMLYKYFSMLSFSSLNRALGRLKRTNSVCIFFISDIFSKT